ncbi:MAG: transcription elongation factor GreA [Dehalococcoidales bacterium]|nr:transcription elongation factor GreA [Dehalococcoidales bacterium]
MSENNHVSLDEAAGQYMAGLSPEEKEQKQAAILNFVRWFGRERTLNGLTAPEVGNYAERLSLSDPDFDVKLEMVRDCLNYAKKQKLCQINLAVHLKVRKGKPRTKTSGINNAVEVVSLTKEGHAKLTAELAELKEKRPALIADITRAAADKDVRENAPLEAAREAHGMVEGRIREIESILKKATIVDKQQTSVKVHFGDSIVLVDLQSNEETPYMIVSPREVDPSRGKISGVSPVGKACIGRNEGETVTVMAPLGKMKYQIKQIKR